MTLTTRLLVFFLSTLAVVLVGFSVGIFALAHSHLYRQASERLDTVMNTLSGAIESGPSGVEWEPANRHLNLDFSQSTDAVVWRVGGDNNQLLDRSKGTRTDQFLANPVVSARIQDWSGKKARLVIGSWEIGQRRFHPDSQLPNQAEATHVGTPDNGPLYPEISVTAAVSLDSVQATLRQLTLSLIALSLGIWCLAFFVGRFICRRALLPVHRMANAAAEINADDLSQRLPAIATADELGDLNRAFNTLLNRLQIAFERQQKFTADASHQLRTPLTIILGKIDVALRRERSPQEYREVLLSAQKSAEQLAKLVESLLFLARADAEAPLPHRERLDLATWVPEHLANWSEHLRCADIAFQCSEPGPFVIDAHPTLLGELLNILVDNALKYSDPQTPVKVRLQRVDDAITLQVLDYGCGMSVSDVSNLFVPFFRSTEARRLGIPGIGLGLSIAKRLTEALSATLSVVSRPHQGSSFTLQFRPALPMATDHSELGHADPSAPRFLPSGQ